MPNINTSFFLSGDNSPKNQNLIDFFASPFIDGTNNLKMRAITGGGVIGEPFFSGVAFHPNYTTKDNALRVSETNYQEEIVNCRFDKGSLTSVFERSVAQYNLAYFRIDNTGNQSLTNFIIDTSASSFFVATLDWEVPQTNGTNYFYYYSGEGDLLWDAHPASDADYTTNTGEALNNTMKLIRRCTINPRTLGPNAATVLVLNVSYANYIRFRASTASGTGYGSLVIRSMFKR